jgi:hemerythrin-like domain-containing protein
MSHLDLPRREALLAGFGAACLILPAGARAQEQKNKDKPDRPETGAVEDLMREHGILRRVLLVYAETLPKFEKEAAGWDVGAVRQAAQLFRQFGEDYHEKKLEEENIFPAIKTGVPSLFGMTQVLMRQHERGREITDHILGATEGGKVKAGQGKALAKQLREFVRMYQNHAAREDTILFPAWKQTLSQDKLDEISDKFEGIEKQTFGHDGFDDAVKQIADIEGRLGLSDLDSFTPQAPALK